MMSPEKFANPILGSPDDRFASADDHRPLQQLWRFYQHGHYLVGGRDIAIRQTKLGEDRVAADEVGDGIFEVRHNPAQCGFVWRRFDVVDDVGGDTKLFGNAHGIGRRVSIGVMEDGGAGEEVGLHSFEPNPNFHSSEVVSLDATR
jgi:hypothetical protein